MEEQDKKARILIVDDDESSRRSLSLILGKKGYDAEAVVTGREALEKAKEGFFNVALIDIKLPDMAGVELLAPFKGMNPDMVSIMITGYASVETAVQALNDGASAYIRKPFDIDEVLVVISESLEKQRLVEDKRRAEEALRRSETNFREVITNSADSMVIVGTDGIVRFVNPAAESLFGRRADQLAGTPFSFPIVPGDTTELNIARGDGKAALVEMRVVESEWYGENAYLASLRDITERQQLLAELVQTRQQQLELKSQFLSHVSHELRSPLAVVHQFTTILLDGLAGNLSPEQYEHLDVVLRNAKQLQTMVDDLLEVTRAEMGRLAVNPRYLSLEELISEALEAFQAATTKGISLSADVYSDLPPVCADPDRVRQILINLIDNAFKFTPENGTVTVGAREYIQDPEFVCVSVADTGRGIPPEESEKIFDYLYQIEASDQAGHKGLGLGLYICKELVSLQGGQMWVESQPGLGSTFFFTLPLLSVPRLIAPVLTERDLLTGSTVLITIEILPVEKRILAKTDITALQEAWNAVQGLILPGQGVLLPIVPHTGSGEVFLVAQCADESGAEALAQRIRESLACCEALQNARLDHAVRLTMLDIPLESDAGREQLQKHVARSIEERLKTAPG